MFCSSCGKEVKEGKGFCEFCGAKLSESTVKSKTSKGKTGIFACVILCVVALMIVLAWKPFSDPIKKYSDLINQKDYQGAASFYQKKILGDVEKEEEAKTIAYNKAQELYQAYDDGLISFDDAHNEIIQMVEQHLFYESDELLTKLSQRHRTKEALETGNQYYEDKMYQEAIDAYSEIPISDQEHENVQKMIQTCKKEMMDQFFVKAETMAESGNYLEAVDYINTNKSSEMDYSVVDEKISEYQGSFINEKLEQAKVLFDQNKVIEAIEILKAANDSLQADEFVTKIDEYEKYRPKSLAEMEPMSKGNNVGFSDDGVVKDTFGNSYTGYVLFETWNGKKMNHQQWCRFKVIIQN